MLNDKVARRLRQITETRPQPDTGQFERMVYAAVVFLVPDPALVFSLLPLFSLADLLVEPLMEPVLSAAAAFCATRCDSRSQKPEPLNITPPPVPIRPSTLLAARRADFQAR